MEKLKNKFLFFILTGATTLFLFFVFSIAHASESAGFLAISGADTSNGVETLLSEGEVTKLSISDDSRIQSNGAWPNTGLYDENKYIEFNFNGIIPEDAIVENVFLSHEYYETGTLTGAKFEIYNGESFTEVALNLPENTGTDGEIFQSIDISSIANTPIKIKALKVKFLAFRVGDVVTTKTSHDFIGLSVSYSLSIPIPPPPPDPAPSSFTEISSNITNDTTWTIAHSPYIITKNIEVVAGATLNIDPGVIIKISDGRIINVKGCLWAEGTYSERIIFTSINDDEYGGDTGDGDLNNVLKKWQTLAFTGGSLQNSLKYVSFFYSSEGIQFSKGSSSIFEDINIDHSFYGIKIFESNLAMKDINIINGGQALIITDTSNVTGRDINIENTSEYAIHIYNNSSAIFENISLKKGFLDGIKVSYGGNLHLTNSTISDFANYGISCRYVSSSYPRPTLNISNAIIKNNNYGIYSFYCNDTLKNNSIMNNSKYGLFNLYSNSYHQVIVNASDNYWGDPSGPYHVYLNNRGLGNPISDGVSLNSWLEDDPALPLPVRDPVVLIPGIMGTQIFKNYDDNAEIWPNPNKLIFSITDNFLNDLALDLNGIEDPTKSMRLGDIIRGTNISIAGYDYQSHVFDGLIDELKAKGYVEGKDLFVFPYDWRKSNTESSVRLKEKIDQILADTELEKVDLVTHSMGGLVAKKYIADNGGYKVDQLIFIGTPQLGAPKAFKVIMYGDDMGIAKGNYSFLSPNRVKYISQNMPGVFELLPSKKYVDGASDFIGQKYITDFVTPSLSFSNNSLKPELSYNETEDFMKRQGKNAKILETASNFHESIDNLDLSGVKVSNFIGCGATKTISRITVKKKKTGILFWQKFVDAYEIEYKNGDDTVPLLSANASMGNKYYVSGYTHGELPSARGIKENVSAIVRDKNVSSFPNVSDEMSSCSLAGKTISLISDVSTIQLLVYDNFGNYTGPLRNDKKPEQDPSEMGEQSTEIEYGIYGVQYDRIGNSTFAFLPSGSNYRIVINNLGSSRSSTDGVVNNVYNLSIENIKNDDTKIDIINFDDVPITNTEESFQIEIPWDSFPNESRENISSVINVDENADDSFEREIQPSDILNENEVNDILVPNTTNFISENNIVSLVAVDENSGILETDYSKDGGITWAKYTEPFEVYLAPGGEDVVVKYFSIDRAGNIEPTKEIIIKAPPLPIIESEPSIEDTLATRRSSGGRVLLFSEEKSSDLDFIQDAPLLFPPSSIIKEVLPIEKIREGSTLATNLNLINSDSITKTIVSNDLQESLPNSVKESQIASAVTSNEKTKLIWIMCALLLLIGISFLARKYRNGKIENKK